MERRSKVGLVCCSNGISKGEREKIETLHLTLEQMGLTPFYSDCIYERTSIFSGTGKERAESLMNFYRDDEIKAIFDLSGGDIANEVLSYLDYDIIARSTKMFWGYSDLTTVINAIYAKTGKTAVLYQIRNLIYKERETQIRNFTNSFIKNQNDLFSFQYEFIQGDRMRGVVVGGNIRCLLKLAGTLYWPDMNDKILFLESYGGTVPQMVTFLNHLKHIGVFDKINGILLGTFTQMEKENSKPSIVELVKESIDTSMPIAITKEIGHGVNSKAIVIGQELYLNKQTVN